MKKLLSLIMVLFISAFSFSTIPYTQTNFTVNAAEVETLFKTLTSTQIMEQQPVITNNIKKQILSYTTDISMTNNYKLPQRYINDIFSSILFENPQIFYVDPHTVSISVSNSDDDIVAIRPTYLFPKDELESRTAELEAAANKIISGIDESWSTMQKCRYVHDMIALNCEYYSKDTEPEDYSVYTAYGALVKGVAYCEGYTLAYNYIMKKLGITAYYIQSPTVNHAWSLVNIDGYYYHVDVTYDDPSPDTAGRVFHDFCIVSDAQMNAYDNDENNSFKHTGWVSTIKADNGKYNVDWWRQIETAIFPVGDKEYYIDHSYTASGYGALLAYDDTTEKTTEVNRIENRWYVEGKDNTYWQGNFSYLFYDGSYLYYNDTTNVYRLSPNSTQRELFYNRTSDISHYIYGFTQKLNGKMYISAKATPNDKDVLYEIESNINNSNNTNPTTSTDSNTDVPATSATEATKPTSSATTITWEPVVTVPVSTYSRTLDVGRTYTLSAKNISSGTKISYKNSNSSVVKVTSKGKVTALKKGTSTVTLTLKQNGSDIGKIKCKITVKKDPSLSKKSITVKKKSTARLSIKGKATAINNKYTNTSIAKITSKKNTSSLKVKGLKKGKTTLKIKVNGVKTLKLTVKVT